MSWDIVLFNSTEKIENIQEVNEDALEATNFSEILEKSFDVIIEDDSHRAIKGDDFSIEFFVPEADVSNTILNLYGENAIYALIEIAKKHGWQIYDTGIDAMIDLERPEINGYQNHPEYLKRIRDR